MYISNYMTKDPVTISSETVIPEARLLLNEYHFRHLPVVDLDGQIVGMVSDRDIRSAYPSSVLSDSERRQVYERVEKTVVAEIMTTDWVGLNENSTLDDALLLFDRDQMGALPVLDKEKRLVGIFSIRDLTSAYKSLFGVQEKGSALIILQDDNQPGAMSRIVSLLEDNHIPLTRLIRSRDRQGNSRIYVRIHTCKLSTVHNLLQDAGFIFGGAES